MQHHTPWVLAADIGGTNARFACVPVEEGKPQLTHVKKYATADYDGVEAVLEQYLEESDIGMPLRVAMGVAGPVVAGQCYMPNAGWRLDEKSLADKLAVPVLLVNDMRANASGLPVLDDSDFVTLQTGVKRKGHKVLVSPGTGLGKAVLAFDAEQDRYVIVAGEGGHTDFSPRDKDQDALLEFLRPRFDGRVSAERLCSGQGFPLLFEFMVSRGEVPDALIQQVQQAPNPTRAMQDAFDSGDVTMLKLFRLYARMLGNEAGDLALVAKSVGGVYLGGGIPPYLLPWIQQDSTFMDAFLDKAPHSEMLKEMPVRLITNSDTALLGSAVLALRS